MFMQHELEKIISTVAEWIVTRTNYNQNYIHRGQAVSQNLRQRNTSEQIEQV